MASLEEIRAIRLEKLKLLKEAGMDAYPISSKRDLTLAEATEKFEEAKSHTLAGRVMALRPQGGLIFFHLDDGTGRFQGLFKKEETSDKKTIELFDLFAAAVDIGDFIEMSGKLFVTKRGEKTLQVESWRMLAKSLRQLPEKWHGLQDLEERFRRRYLDSLMSEEVKARFIVRSKIIAELRHILNTDGFLEVETPILQPLAGGASAEPFKTHHNALDIDLFLRIAPELYLKKMLVGGFPKVFEIARNFRNEGIDMTHNPEFTMLEYYESYSDSTKQRAYVEKIFKTLVKNVFGKLEVAHDGKTIDFAAPFEMISFYDLLTEYSPLKDAAKATKADAEKVAKTLGLELTKGDTLTKILDAIYKKTCRPKIIQPTFVIDYPVEYLPLAKRSEKSGKDASDTVDAFQFIAGGLEIVKAFSELNDPIDQGERFAEQDKNKKAGDKEAQSTDTDYLEAMEYGMPPAGGVGIGIDRLVLLLTDTKNIKEIIYFPTMKPKA